jgi:hypothetical protein
MNGVSMPANSPNQNTLGQVVKGTGRRQNVGGVVNVRKSIREVLVQICAWGTATGGEV